MSDASRENPLRAALFTDQYELTMAQAYDAEGMDQLACFELFFRKMPKNRNYIVAAGLEDVLQYLENLQVRDDDLDYLRRQKIFSETFLDRLHRLSFRGDVYAMPEGTPVFPYEPIVQVVAPVVEAQLMETFIINQVHFQSVAATKAARVVGAAEGRNVVDFGSRRAHGADAALKAARVCYLAGAGGTSNVLAGKIYGIPIVGTMAHSYIQAHDNEQQAFEAFGRLYPDTTLLVDTYDTLVGVQKVIDLSHKLQDRFRFRIRAVRLDSGDLAELSKQTRKLLDEAGLGQVRIFTSSGLDEFEIAHLLAAGAPIDGFGVGTKLVVSPDASYLDIAYKLVEYAGSGRTKLSSKKVIYPGRKQVFRKAENGRMVRDTIGYPHEPIEGQPQLVQVMRGGRRLPAGERSLDDSRRYAREQWESLPQHLRRLESAEPAYPVEVSRGVQGNLDRLRQQLAASQT